MVVPSAPSVPSLRINAPYVYMTKQVNGGATTYTLYVFIAIYEGTTLSEASVTQEAITYTIAGTATSTNIVPKYFQPTLLPLPASTPGSLEKPDFTVAVKKIRDTTANPYQAPAGDLDPDISGDRETTLRYEEDADEAAPIIGNTAFNCPYVYLTNPSAIIGIETDFAGRCHIPLQGFDYDRNAQLAIDMIRSPHPGTINNLENGEQVVNISPSLVSTKTEVDHNDIDCNKQEYKDEHRQVGYFEVKVVMVDLPPAALAAPPRKIKLRNLSSDTHPNSFIG